RPHADRRDLVDGGFPDLFAAEVVAIQPVAFRAEPRVNEFAIGRRSRRGIAAFAMTIIEDGAFVSRAFPQHLSAVAIKTQNLEGMFAISTDAVGMHIILAFDDVFDGLRSRHD